jgi:hypothetical protein
MWTGENPDDHTWVSPALTISHTMEMNFIFMKS